MARKLTYEELEKTVRELQKEAVECKQAKEKLYEQLNMHRTILASTPDLFVVKDRDSVYRAANLAFCKFVGKKEEEIIGKTDFDLFPRAEAERYRRDDERIMETGIPQVEDEETTGSEGRKYLQVAKTPVVDETGTCVGVLCSVRDITERKRAEEALREREATLVIRTTELEEVNRALRVLLKRMDEDKRELEEKVSLNVKELVVPFAEKLKNSALDAKQMTYLSILESNLNSIVSPFVYRLSSKYLGFTPTEIQVASLVRDGKTTKEIAELLNSSDRTIESHRQNIRMKIGIKNIRANLRSFLLSM